MAQSSKKAKKATKKTVRPTNEPQKASSSKQAAFHQKIEQSRKDGEAHGSDALSALKKMGGQKLPRADVFTLARRLHDERPVLKRHLRAKGMKLGEFCGHFDLADSSETSKELSRLTLPPNRAPAQARLRRSADKYYRFIKGIGEVTAVNINTLADRMLRGTSLHPEQHLGSLSEAEKVEIALRGIVERIDAEFGLYEKFMELAKFKAAHIAAGGTEHWPVWPPHDGLSDQEKQSFNRNIADAKDPRYAFWQRAHATYEADSPFVLFSYALPYVEFFYIPHAPLGVIDYCNLPKRQESEDVYNDALQDLLKRWREPVYDGASLIENEYSIKDDWDPERKCPVGQIKESGPQWNAFAWLIIYPSQDHSRLMPMLYVAGDMGTPDLEPLDARSLESFRDAVWADETRHMSVFERIKELIGYRPGMPKVIEDGFRRTAPWLDHNPLFKIRDKAQKEMEEDTAMLDAYLKQLWKGK